MVITVLVAGGLVWTCFFIHLTVLNRLARIAYHNPGVVRHPLLLVILALFAAHLLEVVVYALALSFLDAAGLGRLTGAIVGGPGWFIDHFYFSIASYTTLGIGDVIPEGNIRIVAGVEALNGLMLVAWSASFAYLVMERLWGDRGPTEDLIG